MRRNSCVGVLYVYFNYDKSQHYNHTDSNSCDKFGNYDAATERTASSALA